MSETKEEKKEEKKEKCFVIMPISDQGDYPAGHFTKVYEQIIKPAVEETGYEAYRVDENKISDSIINKIFSAIQECPMAICDLSNRNPNVLYELGLRQAYDKPVVLIQDDKTEKIFDVSGISTISYKSARLYEDVIEARKNIKNAILSTREGKVSTLAKVIKVNIADFSQVKVSQGDKTNVILEGIYSEIRGLKKGGKQNYTSSREMSPVEIRTMEELRYQTQIAQFNRELQSILSEDEKISLFKNISDLQDEIINSAGIYAGDKEELVKIVEEIKDKAYKLIEKDLPISS